MDAEWACLFWQQRLVWWRPFSFLPAALLLMLLPSRTVRLVLLLTLLVSGSLASGSVVPAAAQQAPAAPGLQSPETFLGYALGERFTPHHRVVDYVQHVTEASPNVALQQYGSSYEGRPLLLATVTSAANHDRVDQIRQDNLRRAGLLEGAPSGDPTAVVWLSYNVHGNESVSTEAALQTLYDLANPQNARTQAWLQNTVVLLDPCLNPDGRERYVQWYTRTVGATPNVTPEAREHDEPWPGGRTNHYYFDLNRDWAWGSQQETQQRLAVYHRWMPHVHVDFHEQGVNEPYYFAPAANPFHEDITEWQRDFQFAIGRNHARYFDANNWLYFTREVFDLFYPGYGDTWPIFNGAIGMTYEQGGSGRAGLGVVTAEGDTLTLADRIAHHHTTGLSTVEVTSENQARVVQEFADYHETARTDPPGDYAAYVVKRDAGGDRMRALTAHLDRQNIRYGFAQDERRIRGRSYRTGASDERATLEAGDLVIDAAQPKGHLVKVLFEPEVTIIDSLTYDITAWALPYVYGMDAYALPDRIEADTDTPPAANAGLTGASESPYAYVTPWSSRADVRFAGALLQRGIGVRFASEEFAIDGRTYAPGTLLITRTGNNALGDRFDRIVRETAAAHQQPLHAVSTGFVERGPDFGSSNVGYIDAPHVAVLAGEPLYSYNVGEVWHYFDQIVGYPATLLHADGFSGSDLDDVDVLVMPSGSYGEWLSSHQSDLVRWIRSGGRLIALGRGAHALANRSPFALRKADDEESDDGAASEEDDDGGSPEDALRRYGDRERDRLTTGTPGSIHRARVDASHPLGFGLGDTYFALKRSDEAFAYFDEGDGWNVATLATGTPVSGFMGHEAQDAIAETLVFGTHSLGAGDVVYFPGDPLFRGFWYTGQVAFANAVFFVGND